jgi:hypothetical protein
MNNNQITSELVERVIETHWKCPYKLAEIVETGCGAYQNVKLHQMHNPSKLAVFIQIEWVKSSLVQNKCQFTTECFGFETNMPVVRKPQCAAVAPQCVTRKLQCVTRKPQIDIPRVVTKALSVPQKFVDETMSAPLKPDIPVIVVTSPTSEPEVATEKREFVRLRNIKSHERRKKRRARTHVNEMEACPWVVKTRASCNREMDDRRRIFREEEDNFALLIDHGKRLVIINA